MGVTCDPGCATWAKSFGDCICSSRDLISFIIGLASIVCMGLCCLPQILSNFLNGSSEGLSFGLVLIWAVGDVCNLAGVFLSKALPTQVYMAVLYSVLDLLLNFQHCFYNFYRKPRQKRKQQQQEATRAAALAQQGTNSNNPSNEQAGKLQQLPSTETASLQKVSGNSASNAAEAESGVLASSSFSVASNLAAIPAAHHLRALSAGLMLSGGGMLAFSFPMFMTAGLTGTLPGASAYRSDSHRWGEDPSLRLGRVLLTDSGATAASGRTVDIGQGLGWGMTVTYLGARVPQIVKNFRRGTAEGLSPFMFVLLVLGSITYALSIFIRSVEAQFIVPKLPWLIEALGAILLDGSIVFQIFYYRRKNKGGSAAAVGTASELPLGTIAP